MRTLLCLAFVGCGSTSDLSSAPAPTPTPTPPADSAIADAAVADTAPSIGRFTCGQYQTFCGGIDRYAFVCREDGGVHVLHASEFALGTRTYVEHGTLVAELRYLATPPETLHLTAGTCAGKYEFDVEVNAVLVAP